MPREIEASVQMKLYTLTKRKFAAVFVVFFVCFLLSVIVGLVGPKVIYSDSQTKELTKDDYGMIIVSVDTGLFPLTSMNQQLWLLITPVLAKGALNSTTGTISGDITPKISFFYSDDTNYEAAVDKSRPPAAHKRHVSCVNKVCNTISLLHLGYIDKSKYKVSINLTGLDKIAKFDSVILEFKTYRTAFTQLELWFRVVFLALTFVVTILYTRLLRPYNWKDWSIEQKWMMILLPLLLLYNNPLFPLAFLVSSFAPFVLDGIFQATFLSALLLFWLCIYHSIRQPKRRCGTFYVPKLILIGLIWLAAVVLSTWQAVVERTDPAYNLKVDTVNFMGFKIFLLVMASLYSLFLLYLLIRAFIELRNVAYFDLRLKFTTVFIVFVFSISLAIIILRFGSGILDENFISDVSSRYGSAAEFLSFYGLLNFYIYTMAYVYSPSKNALTESRLHDNPVVTMLNESDEDVMYGSEREDDYKPLSNNFMSRFGQDSD